jgi:hypothetical protein
MQDDFAYISIAARCFEVSCLDGISKCGDTNAKIVFRFKDSVPGLTLFWIIHRISLSHNYYPQWGVVRRHSVAFLL